MQGRPVAMPTMSSQPDLDTPLKASSLDAVTTAKGGQAEESIAEPELLALIIELRLNAGGDGRKEREKGSTAGSVKSTVTNTTAAVDTLDLCHRKIEKLPHDMMDIIRDDVIRLALGYNLISALPTNFSELSKLRYLNIRANLITTFPSVLCTLPSLEILDISRNKIKKLPSEPGRLSELRVLSISNNRLRKLPSWLQGARHLRILKIEGNPITWPPPHISVMPPFDKASTNAIDGSQQSSTSAEGDKETQQVNKKRAEDRHMALWIQKVRQWMAEDEERSIQDVPVQPATESLERFVPDLAKSSMMTSTEPLRIQKHSTTVERAGIGNVTDHTPSGSTRDIDAALLSIGEGNISDEEREKDEELIALPVKLPVETSDLSATDKVSVVAISGPAQRLLTEPSNSQGTALESVIPLFASPEQVKKVGEANAVLEATTGAALQEVIQVSKDDSVSRIGKLAQADPSMRGHTRNGSLSTALPTSSVVSNMATTLRRGLIRNKKSLPDLRQTAGNTSLEKRQELTSPIEDSFGSVSRPRRPSVNTNRRPPIPSAISESILNQYSKDNSRGAGEEDVTSRHNKVAGSEAIASSIAIDEPKMPTEAMKRSTSTEPVEEERNSYFRRYSTLPISTISKSISIPVLQCIDATRGILYALSQMHSALKQYIIFASDDRMTSQLSRALDIASTSMGNLIQSLDQFDSLSRIKGGALSTTIVGNVISTCSDSVITFRKIISLLHLQLKTLQKSADIRYTRTLLLLLYGSLAEINHSWTIMEPLFAQVIPYLNGQEVEATSQNTDSSSTALPIQHGSSQTYTLPSIAEASSPILANGDRSAAMYASNHLKPQRRRHAGSFSAQDVAQGANMIPTAPLPTTAYEDIRRGQRPIALGPFAEQQGRSTSYQVQQGDLDGTDLVQTGRATPNEIASPQSTRERPRRNEDVSQASASSKRSMSNTSAGKMSAVSRSQGSNGSIMQVPQSALNSSSISKVAIDDHLVLLLVKVTSVAYGVWASIMDYLAAVDISASVIESTDNPADASNGQQQKKTPETSPNVDEDSFLVMSPQTPLQNGSIPHRNGSSNKNQLMSPASDISRGKNGVLPSSSTYSKLQKLSEMTLRLVEQTNSLQACCDKVQEKSGIASAISSSSHFNISLQQQLQQQQADTTTRTDDPFQLVYLESSSFIKSILQVSHFIKSLSLEHTLPKIIKINLSQLTTCARDLTLYLHFLGGPPSNQSSSNLVSPAQHRGDDQIKPL